MPSILLWIVLSISALGAVALWDEQRESAAAMADFAREQAMLARALGAALSAQLAALRASPDDAATPEPIATSALAAAAGPIEHAGEVTTLLEGPAGELVQSSGQPIRLDAIEQAFREGLPSVRLSRPEAAKLGLPARTAVAGLSEFAGPGGHWRVAVIATALRERDREVRAVYRLILGFSFASALIVAFGAVALRMQRKELALAHELALADVLRARDERLIRADKLATLGALATGIAHEVSTPLGVIMGRAEQLLPRVENDGRTKRAVEVIVGQAERISQIIRSFLRLARGAAPSLERVDPASLANAAVELVEHRFQKAGIGLDLRVGADLPRVACDPKLFEQVLVNLLLNACDACGANGGKVELAVTAEQGVVAFVVTDDGTGITENAAQRATEPFFTTKGENEGTGLGLAIANEIVKHHHGDLVLEPRKDSRGTRAVVEIGAVREAS
jgi:signal transduction histidine kinase